MVFVNRGSIIILLVDLDLVGFLEDREALLALVKSVRERRS